MKERINYFDSTAGVTIILVVFAHFYFPEMLSCGWYVCLRNYIYRFHMELFMFISGFVVFYSYKPITDIRGYYKYIKKKALKFIPAYFILGFLFLGVDAYTQSLPAGKIFELIKNLFLIPINNSANFTWYIYVLFFYYLITPAVIRLPVWLRIFLSFLFLAVSFFHCTIYFALNMFIKYMFFFLTGSFVAENPLYFKELNKKWGKVFVLIFLFITWLVLYKHFNLPYQLISIIAIPAFFYLTIQSFFENFHLFNYLGRHSYFIYLFNTLCIGLLYLPAKYLNLYSNINIAWFILPFFVSGIFGSLLIENYLRKISFINKYM